MKTFPIILFFLISFSVFSQNTIHPIKENGQWGFINDSGVVVLPAQYDAIKNEKERDFSNLYAYFLVEKNKKFGIVNNQGVEVLPPLYPKGLEFIALNPLLFKIKTPTKLLVIGENGKEWSNLKGFDDVLFFNKKYLLIKKNEKWGIYDRNKGVIISPRFDSFQYNGYQLGEKSKFFIFNDKNKKGLIDTLGTVIIPPKFDTIINIHSQISICKVREQAFELYNKGDSLGISCLRAVYFSDSLIRVHFENGFARLFNVYTFKWITPIDTYTYFRTLSPGRFYIETKKNRKYGLIDYQGNEILMPQYSDIRTFNPSKEIFRYGSNKNWGIVQKGDSIIQDSIFEFIGKIKENKGALVLKNKKVGLLNTLGVLILPVEYDEIEIKSDKVRAFKGRNLTEFTLSNAGTLTETRQLKNVFTIRAGYKNLLRQQTSFIINSNSSSRRRRPNWQAMTFNSNRNNLIIFAKLGLKGLKNASTEEIVLPAEYSEIYRVTGTSFCILKKALDKPQMLLSKIYETEVLEEVFIFSETEKKIIHSGLLGIRYRDYETSPYAAFIRKNGSFGLLKKDGSLKMNDKGEPFTATFIDEFSYRENITRAYFGGYYRKMDWMTSNHPNELGSVRSVIRPFRVLYSGSLSDKNVRLMDGKWAYMDSLGQFLTQPDFIVAHYPSNNKLLCETPQGMGLLSTALDTLLPFEYKEIKDAFYFRTNYWELTKKNETPVFLTKKGESIQTLAQYDKIMPFQKTLTAVLKDTLWGFINQKYEEVIPCQYRLVRAFSEGLAAVRTTEGWHYINETGEKVLELNPNIRNVGQMKSGMAWFSVGSIFGFSSVDNPVAIFPKFTKASDFDGDVAVIKEKAGFGIIDRNGKYILKPSLRHIKSFNNSEVTAYKKSDSRFWGLISKQGEFITDAKFDLIGQFKNGYAKIRKGYSYGLIDSTGKIVIPIEYDGLGYYNEGLITARPRYGKWQYINLKNQVIIKDNFQKIEAFKNGKAVVTSLMDRKNAISVINKNGSYFYKSVENQKALHYQEGIVGIQKTIYSDNFRRSDNIYYYIDSSKNIIRDDFIEIQPFQNGLAIVKKERGFGVIDEAGMYIIEPKYQQIVRLSNGIFKAINVNHKGLALKNGTIIIEPKYDYIKKNNLLLKVSTNAQIGYFKRNQKWLWSVE